MPPPVGSWPRRLDEACPIRVTPPARATGVVSSYATMSAGLGRFLRSHVLSGVGVAMKPQGIGHWLRGRRVHPGAAHAHQRVGGALRTSWARPAHAALDGAAPPAPSPSHADPDPVSLHEVQDPEPPGPAS